MLIVRYRLHLSTKIILWKKKSELAYRVAKGESLSVIAFKLLPEYPESGGWYSLMDTLVRLNPEVLDNNEVGIIRAGTLLKLPIKESNIPENHTTDPRQQQTWDAIAEQRRREQAKEMVAAPYHRISDALAIRAIQENRYMVSAGHSISIIATQLLPYFPEYGSLTGLMKSLHQLNPDAFIDNDINRLRSNVPLRLPATIRP